MIRAADPHHDGSSLYVSDSAPTLGSGVSVRLRVPHAARVSAVHVRTTPDGEQFFTEARVVHRSDTDSWWQADLTCHNPVTNYRFLLEAERGEGEATDGTAGTDHPPAYRWLNGTGVHLRDVPDAADFRLVTFPAPPAWAPGSVVYQVFPDRFARHAEIEPVGEPGGPRADLPAWAVPAAWDDRVNLHRDTGPRQVFGGTLEGIRQHLDHLVDLGATVLYLTPFFPARSNHRYDASSFEEVDPVLGDTATLRGLQAEARKLGLRVMGDVTTNHTGDSHEWFRAAVADPEGEHAGWYVRDPEQEADDGWVSWLGVGSLPKLDYTNPAVGRAVYGTPQSVIRRWLGPGKGLDAWRVDVANMTGRFRDVDVAHDVARGVRGAVEEVAAESGEEHLLVAEHTHDHSADARGDGWHGVMNYSGFTRPVWTWLGAPGIAPKFLGSPVRVPRLGAELVAETMREFSALVPWRSLAHSMTLVGSHDTTRVRTLVGGDLGQVGVAAALLLTMPGIPMITYGDEIGMAGDFGEDGRRPMPWGDRDRPGGRWNADLLETYRTLIGVRRGSVALSEGGMRWVHAGGDAMVYLREHPRETVLVHIARGAHPDLELDARLLPGVSTGRARYGSGVRVDGDRLLVSADRPGASVWSWTAPVPDWQPVPPGGRGTR